MISDDELRERLPWPLETANKYSRGKLVVVAGCKRYPGAAVLAARASQRMGAGYTEVVTAPESVNVVRAASASLVVRPWNSWKPSELPAVAQGKPCAACVGPGFAPDDEVLEELTLKVLRKSACPVLVDGGGLARLASRKALRVLAERAEAGWSTVLTPHGGEAARLAESLGVPTGDPERLAAGLALATRAVVVLKGPDTFVSDGRRTVKMGEGGPELAKAGTGDVLAGMVSALLAQGVECFDAAYLGAVVHARAGSAAAERYTSISVTAEDVVDAIPEVLRELAGR